MNEARSHRVNTQSAPKCDCTPVPVKPSHSYVVLGRRHVKETGNRNFQEFLLGRVGHEEMDCAMHTAKTARQIAAHRKLQGNLRHTRKMQDSLRHTRKLQGSLRHTRKLQGNLRHTRKLQVA